MALRDRAAAHSLSPAGSRESPTPTTARPGARFNGRGEQDAHRSLPKHLHAVRPLDRRITGLLTRRTRRRTREAGLGEHAAGEPVPACLADVAEHESGPDPLGRLEVGLAARRQVLSDARRDRYRQLYANSLQVATVLPGASGGLRSYCVRPNSSVGRQLPSACGIRSFRQLACAGGAHGGQGQLLPAVGVEVAG